MALTIASQIVMPLVAIEVLLPISVLRPSVAAHSLGCQPRCDCGSVCDAIAIFCERFHVRKKFRAPISAPSERLWCMAQGVVRFLPRDPRNSRLRRAATLRKMAAVIAAVPGNHRQQRRQPE
jgi:hypothetical protein